MTHPIDIIANAIRTADGEATLGAGGLAEVAAEALTDEAIVANAVRALVDDRERMGLGVTPANRADLEHYARVVLRSVAGE